MKLVRVDLKVIWDIYAEQQFIIGEDLEPP
jgi:hypothetical protein